MSTDEVMTPRQASIGGRFSRFYARFTAVLCWGFILFLPAYVIFGELGWRWWQVALAQVGITLVALALGALMWSEASAQRADTERLQRVGRPAVAEVLELEVIDPGDGSHDVARMTLRIRGDDVPEFEAVYRVDHNKELYRVGAHFAAIVDPADNLFTLQQI
ncbi:hypothetical protein [Aeromicrobium panaciterrae]|uniref:hypothetical protein n=1 Tax=Aeromicrobium panaciterrae TaxID=363861 RepID=UPI0031DDE164